MFFISSYGYYTKILLELSKYISVELIWLMAFRTGFIVRSRGLRPQMLLIAALMSMDNAAEISIERLFTAYNEACFDLKFRRISFNAFAKQIKKDKFEDFARELFRHIAKGCSERSLAEGELLFTLIQQKLPVLKNMVVSDGSEIRLSDQAAVISHGKQREDCKGVVGTCQSKVHGTFSLVHQSFEYVSITKGTASERAEIPLAMLKYCLWLADAGYIDFDIFKTIVEQSGFFLVRGKKDMNPIVTSLITYEDGHPDKIEHLAQPTPLKQLSDKLDDKLTYDMAVTLRNGLECRVIRTFVPDVNSSKRELSKKKKPKPGFAYYYTNLPQELFDVPQVLAIYRSRWSIELCWRAHKSFCGLKAGKIVTLSTVRGMFYLSLTCQALKTLIAQLVEPYLGGKKLSLMKVAAHTGRVVLEAVVHVMTKGVNFADKLDQSARKLMWNMKRRTKRIPSKTNRAKGKGIYYIIKELQRPTRLLA